MGKTATKALVISLWDGCCDIYRLSAGVRAVQRQAHTCLGRLSISKVWSRLYTSHTLIKGVCRHSRFSDAPSTWKQPQIVALSAFSTSIFKNLQEREAPDSSGFSRRVSLKVSGAPEERAELARSWEYKGKKSKIPKKERRKRRKGGISTVTLSYDEKIQKIPRKSDVH